MTVEELKESMNRPPTEEEVQQMKQNLKGFSEWKAIEVKDGVEFMINMRKEARRQRALKACKDFEIQARKIENVPYRPHEAAERNLAETFEITEEFDDLDMEIIEDDE